MKTAGITGTIAAILCLGACTTLVGLPDVPDGPTATGTKDASRAPRDGGTEAAVRDATLDTGREAMTPDVVSAPCAAGTRRCDDGGVQTCDEAGTWGPAKGCATQSCADAACTGATTEAPSCQAGGPELACGQGSESCCTSLEVPGGTFYRTYTNAGTGPTGEASPATVSSFRLDKYLVTVGRFRQFVTAWNGGAGYTPAEGSGKHVHLNGGKGLVNSGPGGGYEQGWSTSNNGNIAPTNANLSCNSASVNTWTAAVGANEEYPITCVNWYEATAFCIWDGGFLPSQAEWEYAAAGGSEQREYPWGATDPGTSNQYAIYGNLYDPLPGGVGRFAPVGTAAAGAGRWGHLDLAGETWEWGIEWFAPFTQPCTDCAYLAPTSTPVFSGGSWGLGAQDLDPSFRYDGGIGGTPASHAVALGVRCARTP